MNQQVLSVEEYRLLQVRGSKYANQKCVVDGFRFDSRLEAVRYEQLVKLRAVGQVLWFTRQVPFHIAPRVTYRVDFLIHWHPGLKTRGPDFMPSETTLEDVKGFMTQGSQNKIRTVEHLFGVKVQILKREDIIGR